MGELSADKTAADVPTPTNRHVESVIRKADQELRELVQQRAAITRKIGMVKQTIAGLVKLFGEEVLADVVDIAEKNRYRRRPGITDACRRILMEAREPLNARVVRDRIQKSSPEVLADHKDPLATVTTVLSRLTDYGEARTVITDDGRRAWEWFVDSDDASKKLNGLQSPERPAT